MSRPPLLFRFFLLTILASAACDCGDEPRNNPDGGGLDDGDVPDAVRPDGGPLPVCWVPEPDLPTITTCPGDSLPSGACTVTEGSSAAILITGDVLTPGEIFRGGQVLVGADGVIACVGCDCSGDAGAAGATTIVCPDGVVSPSLINAHEHITFPAEPAMTTDERYEHRHDWREGLGPHTEIPSGSSGSGAEVAFTELRHLLGGATSVNGSGTGQGLLRNLDRASGLLGLSQPEVHYQTFPLGDASGTKLTDSCDYASSRDTMSEISGDDAYTPHIAEGIDAAARNEFVCSNDGGEFDLIEDRTAIIHGVGLGASEIGQMAAEGTALIWSPRTNVSLYGDTARVTEYATLGVPIALGTDWLRSGSMNLLRELACADQLNQTYMNGYFTDEQLWLMATRDAAAAMAMDDAIGTLAPGLVADIAIFDATERPDHRAILGAGPADVLLVLRGGEAIYGDTPLVSVLSTGCESLGDVCGADKQVCVADSGFSLAEILAAARNDYQAFYCDVPDGEPTCVPSRNAMAPLPLPTVDGSNAYTGIPGDGDMDGDGIGDDTDNCLCTFNPIRPIDMGAQADHDGDTLGDACDPCPLDADHGRCQGFDVTDVDGDGVLVDVDNCPTVANAGQEDGDADMIGDVCDPCPMLATPPGTQTVYGVRCGAVSETAMLTGLGVTAVASNGFFAQQLEGTTDYAGVDYSGIFVFTDAAPAVLVGDAVTVMGTVEDFFGLVQLTMPMVTVTASGMPPAATVVEPAEIATGGARAEPLESVLVRVETVTVTNADLGFGEFSVDADLRVDDQLFAITPPPAMGEMLSFVQGPLTYSFSNTKILPRDIADVGFASLRVSPAVLNVEPGAMATVTVAIPTAAPAGGAAVTIVVSPPTLLVGPPTILVPAGMRTASADYTASLTEGMGSLTASYGGDMAMATVNVRTAPRLFFSEYVEGSSNNKAIEIVNDSTSLADLSACTLRRYTNGGTSPTNIALSGMLAAGDVHVICNGSLVGAATLCDVTSGSVTHNGNDAYDLLCAGVVIDTFGRIGEDPGTAWMGGGLGTMDYVLTRKCSVTTGDPDGSDAFDPSVDWDGAAWADETTSLTGLGNRSECP